VYIYRSVHFATAAQIVPSPPPLESYVDLASLYEDDVVQEGMATLHRACRPRVKSGCMPASWPIMDRHCHSYPYPSLIFHVQSHPQNSKILHVASINKGSITRPRCPYGHVYEELSFCRWAQFAIARACRSNRCPIRRYAHTSLFQSIKRPSSRKLHRSRT
jgi:hypothetical protein